MPEPIIQHPHDLRLAVLYQTPLPALHTLRRRDVSLGRWRARFCIIGASHQVQFWRDDRPHFAEMLACVDLATAPTDHYYSFETATAHSFQRGDYRVWVQFSPRALPAPPADDGIQFDFPAAAHGVTPITAIRWWQAGDHLHWWTLHTYPEMAGITYVYSQSVLKID